MTFNFDLDLESAWLRHVVCRGTFDQSLMKIFRKDSGQVNKLKLVNFHCDLDLESALLRRGLHIISLRGTFDQSLMKIFRRIQVR